MRITVVGTGNVGAAFLMELASKDRVSEIFVASKREESARAAIMDVASANPSAARRMHFETEGNLRDSDVIVITAGITPKGKTADEIYSANLDINRWAFRGDKPRKSAIVICVATPVDYITVDVLRITGLPKSQVFGFGGDLDSNRLRYVLANRNMPAPSAHAVGEHGPNAIPVYEGEASYAEVTTELSGFWRRIAGAGDTVRNLATAKLLSNTIDSLLASQTNLHNVCAFHSDYDMYLTWPAMIGGRGVENHIALELGNQSTQKLHALLEQRKKRLLQHV